MTQGRVKRRAAEQAAAAMAMATAAGPVPCALCRRPLGHRVEWHHAVPRSEGGRATVPVHPICHRAIHAALPNAALAAIGPDFDALRRVPEIARFVAWVADKPADFHAPTARGRRRDRGVATS